MRQWKTVIQYLQRHRISLHRINSKKLYLLIGQGICFEIPGSRLYYRTKYKLWLWFINHIKMQPGYEFKSYPTGEELEAETEKAYRENRSAIMNKKEK